LASWCWIWKFKVELKFDVYLELAIYACYAISLLMTAGAYHVVTSCMQVELTHFRLLTAKFFFLKYAVIFFNFKWNIFTGVSPTESRLWNKCGSFSAIIWDIWTTLYTQFKKLINIMEECAKITYAFYMIQHEGGCHIDFRLMSIFPGQTTVNNSKTAFSLHVVESASDDYNL